VNKKMDYWIAIKGHSIVLLSGCEEILSSCCRCSSSKGRGKEGLVADTIGLAHFLIQLSKFKIHS